MTEPGEAQHPAGDDWLERVTNGDPVEDGDDVGDASPHESADLYPLQPQEVAPPSAVKRAIYSWAFYLIVMSGITVLAWLAAARIPYTAAAWAAIVITVIATALCVLRVLRGNVLEDRKRAYDEIQKEKPISNRLHEQLWDGEVVRWETRMHPISIIPTVLRRLTATRFRRWLVLIYLAALGVTLAARPAVGTVLIVVGVAAVSFTIMEWSRVRYAVTNKRIMAVEGLVGKKVPAMPRARVTDVKAVNPWTAVVLEWLRVIRWAYGSWDIESAGQDQALKLIHYLPAAVLAAAALSIGEVPDSGDGT